MYDINPILNADSYKASHWLQYPPGTEYVFAYVESRGGEYDKTLFFGLQMFIKEYVNPGFDQNDIDEAAKVLSAHGLPFNKTGWERMLEKHGGKFPVEIKAVPEGMVVDGKNVLVTIVNTDPEFYWITSYLETALLRAVWYPTTVATISWDIKQTLLQYAEETAMDSSFVDMQLHDFGSRGASSVESAAIGGLAHLVNFHGTDTLVALTAAQRYYEGGPAVALSVPATEHSTITSWGQGDERDAYENAIDKLAVRDGIISIVADSYNVYNATRRILSRELRTKIEKSGARLVVRPDSGDPIATPVEIIEILMDEWGSTTNEKGYRVLPDNVRVLQGDGIGPQEIGAICATLKTKGISTENIVFGMGGGLLQRCDRDTLKFAMKTSSITLDTGEKRDVYKDPVSGNKTSKRGELTLVKVDGVFKTVRVEDVGGGKKYPIESVVLERVYRNDIMTSYLRGYTFVEIRKRAESQ